MNDDDFLDRLLNSSGDDLDRLINYDKAKKKRKRANKDIEVDMSDIEKILNSNSNITTTIDDIYGCKGQVSQIVVSSSSAENFPDKSEECFKHIYDQLTNETYTIDRISAIQKSSQYKKRMEVTSVVIKVILVSIGICICLGIAIWLSQILLRLFPYVS
ncbi:MAG: hypothetical protein LIO71_06910 [Ruminococcus sp.]|nr:hypothetical protein [Ruminococcus sp.]